ncbi:MAG: hypothetical protein NVSMB65_07460 [Chloroflexota bacterium]
MAGTEILILIAEDEPPIADLVAEVVTELGCTALIATDGRSALEIARERRPAVLVTDLMMPHLTGAELIATLHADATANAEPPTRVILMTAAGARAAGESGADAVLLKPFDLEALESLLRDLVAAAMARDRPVPG